MDIASHFFSGTSGLVSPPKRDFPEEFQTKSRLCFYASNFNSIEINSSFYKMPQASTIRKWADEVTPGFRFTFKLFRDITHTKGLQYNPEDIDRFFQVISNVGEKKGCLLIQFPPSLQSDQIRQLEKMLIDISLAKGDWDVAVEFRNRSWYQEDVYDLLDDYSTGMVIQDMPSSATPIREQPTEFLYLRFHGPEGRYRGSYDDEFLWEYAGMAKEWIEDGKTVYGYFNNTMGDAVNNLRTLNSYVRSSER